MSIAKKTDDYFQRDSQENIKQVEGWVEEFQILKTLETTVV